MKQLNHASRAHTRRKPPDTLPRSYLIIELPANGIPSPTSNIIDTVPVQVPSSHHHESQLQHAIRAEQDHLRDTCADFLAATGNFLGAIFRWLVWRIVLPVTVAGILLLTLT